MGETCRKRDWKYLMDCKGQLVVTKKKTSSDLVFVQKMTRCIGSLINNKLIMLGKSYIRFHYSNFGPKSIFEFLREPWQQFELNFLIISLLKKPPVNSINRLRFGSVELKDLEKKWESLVFTACHKSVLSLIGTNKCDRWWEPREENVLLHSTILDNLTIYTKLDFTALLS